MQAPQSPQSASVVHSRGAFESDTGFVIVVGFVDLVGGLVVRVCPVIVTVVLAVDAFVGGVVREMLVVLLFVGGVVPIPMSIVVVGSAFVVSLVGLVGASPAMHSKHDSFLMKHSSTSLLNQSFPSDFFFLQICPSSHPWPSFMKSHSSTSSRQYFTSLFAPEMSPQKSERAFVCRGKHDSSSVHSASLLHVCGGRGRHIQYEFEKKSPPAPLALTFSCSSVQEQLSGWPRPSLKALQDCCGKPPGQASPLHAPFPVAPPVAGSAVVVRGLTVPLHS